MNGPPSPAARPDLHSTWHTVRLNWRPFTALGMMAAVSGIGPGIDAAITDGDASPLVMSSICLSAILVLAGAIANVRYFRYNPFTRRIEARGGWRAEERAHPGGGYARLEFSPASGEVREAAFDGRHRRLPIGSQAANRADWARFVQRMFPGADTPILVRSSAAGAASGPAASPSSTEPGHGERPITVGIAKRRYRRRSAVTLPLGLVVLAVCFATPDSGIAWKTMLMGLGTTLIGAGVGGLWQRPYFTYRSPDRITAKNHWGREHAYPREGFIRLEYSPVLGEVHQVRADGKRRRLPVRRHVADPRDWETFVNAFHPSASMPIAAGRARG